MCSAAIQEHKPGVRDEGLEFGRMAKDDEASGAQVRLEAAMCEKCDLSSMNGQALFPCSGAEEHL